MNEPISEQTWQIDGHLIEMPVRVREAAMATAVFPCDAAAAREAVADTPFTPVTVFGRTLSLLGCVRYTDGDLGPYDEFGVELLVRGPDGKPGVFTTHLPVTETFTCSAGRAIWGLPKFVANGTVITESHQTRIDLSDVDQFVLSGAVAAGIPIPGRYGAAARAWSLGLEGSSQGALLQTISRMRISGVRFRFGGSRVAWGEHPMAHTARSLGMANRPLCSLSAQHLELEIANPTVIAADGARRLF